MKCNDEPGAASPAISGMHPRLGYKFFEFSELFSEEQSYHALLLFLSGRHGTVKSFSITHVGVATAVKLVRSVDFFFLFEGKLA